MWNRALQSVSQIWTSLICLWCFGSRKCLILRPPLNSQNDARYKSGQNSLKNNHLASLALIRDCLHLQCTSYLPLPMSKLLKCFRHFHDVKKDVFPADLCRHNSSVDGLHFGRKLACDSSQCSSVWPHNCFSFRGQNSCKFVACSWKKDKEQVFKL